MKAANEYRLPVKIGDFIKVDRTTSPAHVGKLKHSVDFVFAKMGDFSVEGKPIYSAANGVVVHVKDDSDIGGPDEKYMDSGNGVQIRHANNEHTYYEHLKHRCVVVKVGEPVKTGDLIGYSGNTGFTLGSHLHFEVRRYGELGKEDWETVDVRFSEIGEDVD